MLGEGSQTQEDKRGMIAHRKPDVHQCRLTLYVESATVRSAETESSAVTRVGRTGVGEVGERCQASVLHVGRSSERLATQHGLSAVYFLFHVIECN